jgi:YlmC/YmxH family sporulation protein
MCCRIIEMRDKQVICIKDGTIIGCVCDVEIDIKCGKLISIIVFGRPRCFGLFGRCDDVVIPWDCIEIIGADTILVNFDPPSGMPKKRKFLPF